MANSFASLINDLETLKNEFQAAIYRMIESNKAIENDLNAIAPYVQGSQNGPNALTLMQAAYDELTKANDLASDAINYCDQDIARISSH